MNEQLDPNDRRRPQPEPARLCDLLGAAGADIDWTTDTYTTDHDRTEHTTEKLFPLL